MNEEFTLKDTWWLPNKEDQKFFGTLHFSPKEGGILELESSFVDLFHLLQGKTSNPDIILGISRDGKEITLYNCLQKSTKWNFSGYPFSSFLIEKIFIGSHFNEKEEIKFKRVGIRYSHLDKWTKTSGFKIQLEEDKENNRTWTIKYRLPQSIQK